MTVVLNPTQQVAVKRAREALDADHPTAAINSLQLALSLASNRVVRRFIEQELEEAQEKQAAKNARQELAARGARADGNRLGPRCVRCRQSR